MTKEKNNFLSVKFIDFKNDDNMPSVYKIRKWARASYFKTEKISVSIKLATKKEMMFFSKKYLNKTKPCNALSFPQLSFESQKPSYLGDILLCAEVIFQESQKYNIELDRRWAHMIIHSMLHLQGFDHKTKLNREKMEKEEIYLMSKLGYINPYYAY
tara:strand:- start:954 stop:1424 length:471 start_codon:yes stop_codon:yes gene_type:complete